MHPPYTSQRPSVSRAREEGRRERKTRGQGVGGLDWGSMYQNAPPARGTGVTWIIRKGYRHLLGTGRSGRGERGGGGGQVSRKPHYSIMGDGVPTRIGGWTKGSSLADRAYY